MIEHQCLTCGNMWYDTNDAPQRCPMCETEYQERRTEHSRLCTVNITSNYVD